MGERRVVGHDYGAPNHEGVPGLFEPYVATAYADGSCDFEKLPPVRGEAAALAAARTRYREVVADADGMRSPP